jgi:hypothetical protein
VEFLFTLAWNIHMRNSGVAACSARSGKRLANHEDSDLQIRDAGATAAPFSIDLSHDVSAGESFSQALFQQRAWLVEVDVTSSSGSIRYQVSPSARVVADRKISAIQSQIFSVTRFFRLWVRAVLRLCAWNEDRGKSGVADQA